MRWPSVLIYSLNWCIRRISAGQLCSTHSNRDNILTRSSCGGNLMPLPPSPTILKKLKDRKRHTWKLTSVEKTWQRGNQGKQTKATWVRDPDDGYICANSLIALVSSQNWTLIRPLPCVSLCARCIEETNMYMPCGSCYLISRDKMHK